MTQISANGKELTLKTMKTMNKPLTFFLPIIPPTVTHQEKKVAVKNGKPIFYEPPELKDARAKAFGIPCAVCAKTAV